MKYYKLVLLVAISSLFQFCSRGKCVCEVVGTEKSTGIIASKVVDVKKGYKTGSDGAYFQCQDNGEFILYEMRKELGDYNFTNNPYGDTSLYNHTYEMDCSVEPLYSGNIEY